MAALLDAIEGEFIPALQVLMRRAEGDWTRDNRPKKFPQQHQHQLTPSRACPPQASPYGPPSSFGSMAASPPQQASTDGEPCSSISASGLPTGTRRGSPPTKRSNGRKAGPHPSARLRAANVIFRWAVARKRLQSNPFESASLALPKRPPKLREREFHEAEWRTLLRASLQPPPPRMEPHNAAARRWVPWIRAYTGARPLEACQLLAEDIREHKDGGFWYVRITPEAGTVKGNEAREVPLRPHLVEQGFIAFAQGHPRGPLFYDPKARRKAHAADDPANPQRAMGPNLGTSSAFGCGRFLTSMTPASVRTMHGDTPSSAERRGRALGVASGSLCVAIRAGRGRQLRNADP